MASYNDIDTISIMETEQLINQVLAGDQQAITTLYNAYSQKMIEVCNRVVGDRFIAEELAHDAFLLAVAKLNQLSDPKRFGQWLSSITHHIATRYVRRDRTPLTSSIADLSDKEIHQTPSLHCDDKSHELPTIEEIMAAVDQLPEGYGKVFRMSVIQGMSHAEIAETLGIAAHSSSSQLARAKKLLRKALSSYLALLLALFLVPLAVFIIRQLQKNDIQQPIITKQEELKEQQKNRQDKRTNTDSIDNTNQSPSQALPPTPHTKIYIKQYITEKTISKQDSSSTFNMDYTSDQPVDTSSIDTLPDKFQQIIINPNRDIYTTENDDTDILPIKHNFNDSKWGINLAYSGNYNSNINSASPYHFNIPQIPHTGIDPAPDNSAPDGSESIFDFEYWQNVLSNLEFWHDIYNYNPEIYNIDGPNLTIEELNALSQIAKANVVAGNEEIKRETHHKQPFTISLALQYRLNQRWGFETGLLYNHLSSQFIIGERHAGIIDNQEIHYIGVPLKVSYNWINNRYWNIYSSLGFTMEIPVFSSLTSDYILNGSSLLHYDKSLDVPLQWSAGFGVGLQYNITPHFGLFVEPNFQYFIPDRSNIKTYRTEHPYNFTIPIGFRLSW